MPKKLKEKPQPFTFSVYDAKKADKNKLDLLDSKEGHEKIVKVFKKTLNLPQDSAKRTTTVYQIEYLSNRKIETTYVKNDDIKDSRKEFKKFLDNKEKQEKQEKANQVEQLKSQRKEERETILAEYEQSNQEPEFLELLSKKPEPSRVKAAPSNKKEKGKPNKKVEKQEQNTELRNEVTYLRHIVSQMLKKEIQQRLSTVENNDPIPLVEKPEMSAKLWKKYYRMRFKSGKSYAVFSRDSKKASILKPSILLSVQHFLEKQKLPENRVMVEDPIFFQFLKDWFYTFHHVYLEDVYNIMSHREFEENSDDAISARTELKDIMGQIVKYRHQRIKSNFNIDQKVFLSFLKKFGSDDQEFENDEDNEGDDDQEFENDEDNEGDDVQQEEIQYEDDVQQARIENYEEDEVQQALNENSQEDESENEENVEDEENDEQDEENDEEDEDDDEDDDEQGTAMDIDRPPSPGY